MIDISTEGILFLGEVEKHRLKKLVTCDGGAPDDGSPGFYGSCYSRAAFGACCPLIACERGARVLKVQKGHRFFIFRG